MIKQYSKKSDICPWRSWYWCVFSNVFGALICSLYGILVSVLVLHIIILHTRWKS